ncbi:MAG: type II toxin-antitoxin system VapC family toxin [Deltaproteobacteria bacterium]|nr:type II toxin-antitoxin system VapC family toxin [Deltaproteobacteria bacterium]
MTTHLIFAEANSLITKRLGKSVGERTGDLLQRSDFVQLVFLDEVVHREAWNLYKKYRDKDFDYIDATSFVFCKRRGIREVLTFDRHFAQMGFRIVP